MNTYSGVLRFIHNAALVLFITGIFQAVHAQLRSIPTINEVEEFSLPARPTFPTFLSYSAAKLQDLLYFDKEHARLMIALSEGEIRFQRQKEIFSIQQITSLTTGNLNSDGIDDIVIVQREYNKIIVLLSNKKDTSYLPLEFPVNYYPEYAVIGDLSGDNIPDIVTYGKLSSGVSYLRGKGKNKFTEAITLFSSLPVSAFSIIHLNADKIPDVVLRNWLQNEDVFYFGIGRARFSEQTALTYGEDSTFTAFHDFNADGVTDAAVVSSQFRNIQVYHGSGLANVVMEQNLSIIHPLAALSVVQMQEQLAPDLLLTSATNNDFSLMMNKGDGTFYDEIVFGMPYLSGRLTSSDMNNDGKKDIVCFDDSSARYTIFWNAQSDMKKSVSAAVAVGKHPTALSAVDLNGDGYEDLIVSNERSSTLSLLFGSRSGIRTQLSVETSESPSSAMLYSRNDSSVVLLTAHQKNNKIGITTLIKENVPNQSLTGEVESYTIQLASPPSYVLPDVNLEKQLISLYVFLRSVDNPIVFYQQIKGTQFVAKSLTPLIPSRILFATISNLNSDKYSDLVYLYTDTAQSSVFLGITLNDEKDEFKGKTYSYEIPDSSSKRAFVYVDDLNGDKQKDYLLYFQSTGSVYLVNGKQEGEIGTSKIILENVFLFSNTQLQVYDFDRDGIADIVYEDAQSFSINTVKGKGNGTFFPSRQIVRLSKESSFRCGDFNGDGKTDVAYTVPFGHTINITYGE